MKTADLNMKNNMKQSIASVFAAVAFLAASAFADVTEGTDYTIDNTTCTVSIMTANGLQNVGQIDVSGCTGAPTYTLANDIAVNATGALDNTCTTNWDNTNAVFPNGSTFDGNGHTISGVCVNSIEPNISKSINLFEASGSLKVQNINFSNIALGFSAGYVSYMSLFETKDETSVKYNIDFSNIKIDHIRIQSTQPTAPTYVGLLIGNSPNENTITADKIHASDISIYTTAGFGGSTGGLFGQLTNSSIQLTNSYFQGSIYTQNPYIGGMIAYARQVNAEKDTVISNGSFSIQNSAYTGGILGGTGTSNYSSSFKDIIVNADFSTYGTTNAGIGGIVGYMSQEVSFQNVYFTGYFSNNGTVNFVGGIVGYSGGKTTFDNANVVGSSSQALIFGTMPSTAVGGLFGMAGAESIKNSTVNGTIGVLGNGTFMGGIGGQISSSQSVIENSSFTGWLDNSTGTVSYVGGMFGQSPYAEISNCHATGLTGTSTETLIYVKNANNAGGFTGQGAKSISGSYVRGYIGGSITNLGGFMGYPTVAFDIKDSYFLGSLTSSASYRYGFAPWNGTGLPAPSITNSYAIDVYRSVTSPTNDLTILKNAGFGNPSNASIYRDGKVVDAMPAASPAFASALSSFTYNPDNLDGFPAILGALQKPTYRIAGIYKGDTLYNYFTDEAGRIAYNADGSAASTKPLPTTWPKDWKAEWIPDLNVTYSANDVHDIPAYEITGVCEATLYSKWALENLTKIRGLEYCLNPVFKLGEDIVVSEKEQTNECETNWDNTNAVFTTKAVFDGDGHTISGICLNNNDDRQYIFRTAGPAKIKNLTFSNINLQTPAYSAWISIFETNNGTYNAKEAVDFDHVKLEKISLKGNTVRRAGLLVQYARDHYLTLNEVHANNISIDFQSGNNSDIGGFASYCGYPIQITNTSFKGKIYALGYNLGGFIADIGSYSDSSLFVNSSFEGEIDGNYSLDFGGFIGSGNGKIIFDKDTVKATISRSNSSAYVGGFIGYGQGATTYIRNSLFIGNMNLDDGAYMVGSFVAYGTAKLDNAHARTPDGKPSSTLIRVNSPDKSVYMGGLTGYDSRGNGSIKNSSFTGSIEVTSTPYVGGLSGYAYNDSLISSTFNGLIKISSPTKASYAYAGGAYGYADGYFIQDVSINGIEVDGDTTCIVINAPISTTNQSYIGGLVGEAKDYDDSFDIEDSKINGNIQILASSGFYVGGLLGKSNESSIRNSTYNGSIKITKAESSESGICAGGAIGSSSLRSGADPNIISSTLSDVSVKGGKINNETVLLQIEDPFADNDVGSGVSNSIGGLIGHAAGTDSIVATKVYGNIVTNSSFAKYVEIGGLLGFSQNKKEISDYSFIGQIKAKHAQKEGYAAVGGLIGRMYTSTPVALQITDSRATNAENSSNAPFISVSSKFENNFVGGIYGQVNSQQTAENVAVIGKINVEATGNVYLAGLVGNNSYAEQGSITSSYYIGSLTTNSENKHVYGLTNDEKGGINLKHDYAIDFSGTATEPSNIKGAFIGLGTKPDVDAFVYIGSAKVGAAKPQSEQFASLLKAFEYKPDVNEGYPVPSPIKNSSFVWIDDGKIIADVYVENGKAYFNNGTPVNSRTIAKLPKMTNMTISKDSIKFVYWSSTVDGVKTYDPMILWDADSLSNIIQSLSKPNVIAFAKDSITIAKPKFVLQSNDEDPISADDRDLWWNGDNYAFSKDSSFPNVVFVGNYFNQYKKNSFWEIKFNESADIGTLYANNLNELLISLINAVETYKLDKKKLDFSLMLPAWNGGSADMGYEDFTMEVRIANLKKQDLILTIPELGKDIKYPIQHSYNIETIALPKASKIKFSNGDSIAISYESYINDQSVHNALAISGAETFSIPDEVYNVSFMTHAYGKIIIDTVGMGDLDLMVAFDIPTKYDITTLDTLKFPAIASTKACFNGWNVNFQSAEYFNNPYAAPSAKGIAKAPTKPEMLYDWFDYLERDNSIENVVYYFHPNTTPYGDITIRPEFNDNPCNNEVALLYETTDGSTTSTMPSGMEWSISIGSKKISTKSYDDVLVVVLPTTMGMNYKVEANYNGKMVLVRSYGYNTYYMNDNLYPSPIGNYNNKIIAQSMETFDKNRVITTWADEKGQIIHKAFKFNDDITYNIVGDSIFKGETNLPSYTYRKNGKVYYFVADNEDQTVWDGQYLSGLKYKATEATFLKDVKFYITDGSSAVTIDNVNSTWKNVFAESFDLATDSLLPTVAAIFQNAPNNDANQYYYATNTWQFVNGRTTSSSSMASVDEMLNVLVKNLETKSNEYHLFVNFGSNNAYHDATEQMSIPACTEYGCQLRNFNTTIKSNSDVKFSAEVFGQNYEFVASANTNIPKIEKLRFVNARTDSLVILQSNENEELIDYDIVASNDEYKLPSLSSELVLTLKVQEFEENKLNTEIPQTSGMIFRQTSTPERYIDGIPVILPKLGALGMCFDGYEKLDENREVDEFVDLWPNDDGNFVLYTYSNFGEITVRAVSSSEECKVDTNRVTIKADSSAKVTVTMTHFGDTLKTEKGAYLLPAGGSWPVVINAVAKAPTLLDSLYFNDKLIKIGDTVEVSENSVIRLFTTDTTPEVDTTEIYRIAEARVRLSGTAMRFSVTTKDFKVKKPVSLAVRVYKDYEMIIDTVLTDSAENGTYNFDYYPLEPGKYTGEAILDGANGTVTAESNDWEISEERNVVVAGSWSMKSLANVTDDFEIPDDAKGAVYYWDEENALGDYMQYRKVRDIDSLKPTIGYWLVTDEPVDLKRKEELPTEDTLVWNLKNEFSGWNMVANPYPWSIGLDSIDFVDPQDTSDGFWRWNAVTMSYEHTSSVGPYEGLWVHTSENRDVKLANRPFFEGFESEDDSLATANAAEKKAAAKSKFTSGSWALRLILNGENGLSDTWNVVGVGSREFEIEEPPTAMEGGVSLAIENGNRALAKSIKKSVDEASWNIAFSAATLQQGKFTVENLESLEQMGLHASLTMNGNVIPLKAGEPVNLMLSNTAKVAVLKVSTKPAIAVAGGINGLRFGNVGNKFAVSFELGEGYGKNVEVHLVATNGSVVSKASEKSTAGSHKVMLDKPASSGVYVLRISVGKDAKQVLVKF